MTRAEAIKILMGYSHTPQERAALEVLIPELAESEDKIRKAIIGIIKNSNAIDINVSHERMIAYLEKQKDIEDRWIEDRGQCFWDGVEEGKMLAEKQKEQKQDLPLMGGDADTYFDDLRMTTKPLTSREWFEEGIRYAQRLQKEQKPASISCGHENDKPAEWSEEDEKMMENIQYALRYACANSVIDEQTTEYVMTWLKSLRPSWKPSEEQMNALYDILHPADTVNRHALESLYEQLKHL